MGTDALWHVVLVAFREDTPLAARQKIYGRYQTLAEECGGRKSGILFYQADWNRNLSKGDHLVEVAVFASDAAFQAYRRHPKHAELTEMLKVIADWHGGEIPLNFAAISVAFNED